MKFNVPRQIFLTLVCYAFATLSYGESHTSKSAWQEPPRQEKEAKKKSPPDNQDSNPTLPRKDVDAEADPDTIRIETELVVFDVLVLAPNGNTVTGLKQEDFEVLEEGQPQQLGTFALGDGSLLPRMIVLIIDYSLSQFPYLKESVEAAKVLMESLKPSDRMALVTDDVKVLVPFSQDKQQLKEGLDFLAGFASAGYRGRSKQLSALRATLRDLDTREGRPIVVLQSDGDEIDHFSDKELAEIYGEVEQAQATIYTIIPGLRLLQLPKEDQLKNLTSIIQQERTALVKQGFTPDMPTRLGKGTTPSAKEAEELLAHRLREHKALLRISTLAGGWTSYLEQPALAPEIYGRLLKSIEQRYILGYYPTNKVLVGQRRPVEIKVRNHPEYKIVRRNAYHKLGRAKAKQSKR